MKYKLLFMMGLIVLLTSILSRVETAVSLPIFAQPEPKIAIETITLNLPENQLQAIATVAAPFGFNAVVPSWPAANGSVEIHVRTSKDGQNWGDWVPVQAHGDWNLPEDSETTGDMIVVPAAERLHNFIQYDIHSGTLAALSFTFIDTTDGPTTAEMLKQQQQLDAQNVTAAADRFPRPAVVSRAVWCIYDTCDDTSDLAYAPATHLVVHHTATSNENADWASTVRAIYLYHRDNLGWGDIGYNYLLDRDGVIYEGHMNEDFLNWDVVGIHASSANTGSMGAALLGTFTDGAEYPVAAVPPPAMLGALADLFAWKADQRHIEIYDASRPVNGSWGLPHIMSHRDVYGGTNTLCPGGNMQDLLPWLREAVGTRLGQVSPYTFVSEESDAFRKANVGWFETMGGCGWQGHAYYTWTTMEAAHSDNWGEWQLDVPTAGLYEIQVYAPYCDTSNSETTGAAYEIDNGVSKQTAVVNQQENVGLWMSLGTYDLGIGNNTLRLTNLTNTDSGVGIWFDDVRFKPIAPAFAPSVQNNSPVGVWTHDPTVLFDWMLTEIDDVANSTVEVAADETFHTIIANEQTNHAGSQHELALAAADGDLYWRVQVAFTPPLPHLTSTVTSEPTWFGLDTVPPTSTVTAVYTLTNNVYMVTTTGIDTHSGISHINLEYQAAGDSAWIPWPHGTVFTAPESGRVYYFRSQALDVAGNQEPSHALPDMDTSQAKPIPHAIMLPVITR